MSKEPDAPRVWAVPQTYKGVTYRSTLEADWAATFDWYGITTSYEPVAVKLSDGQLYRCDFWLKAQRVWCEVKGPHNLRIDKTQLLYKDLGDQDDWMAPLVVICREPEGDGAHVERADGEAIGFSRCARCDHDTFVDLSGAWQCRVCGFWDKDLAKDFQFDDGWLAGPEYQPPRSVTLKFHRAPRSPRGGRA